MMVMMILFFFLFLLVMLCLVVVVVVVAVVVAAALLLSLMGDRASDTQTTKEKAIYFSLPAGTAGRSTADRHFPWSRPLRKKSQSGVISV